MGVDLKSLLSRLDPPSVQWYRVLFVAYSAVNPLRPLPFTHTHTHTHQYECVVRPSALAGSGSIRASAVQSERRG